MPAGTKIRPNELYSKLREMDIDDGIRIVHAGSKLFVNKSPSDTFVIQVGDSDEFKYLDSARQVVSFIKSRFAGKRFAIWVY